MRRILASFVLLIVLALAAVAPHSAPSQAAPAQAAPVYIADFPFPAGWTTWDGAEPSIFFTRDGCHDLVTMGTYSGQKELFGSYAFRWCPGRDAIARDLGRLTSARGSLEVADRRLFFWGYEGGRLKIYQIQDFVPPDDAQNLYVP